MLLEFVQNEARECPAEITKNLLLDITLMVAYVYGLSHIWHVEQDISFPKAAETLTHLTTEHVSTVCLSI